MREKHSCLFSLYFSRLVEMAVLTGLCLRATTCLLTTFRARCVTEASRLQRLSCTPCTAMASWERMLPRTAQVCHVLCLCICSLCWSPPLLLLAAGCWSPVPLGVFGCDVARWVCLPCLGPSPGWSGERCWRLW